MNRHLQTFFERKAFGVCEWLGEKWGIESSRIRLYFIYVSFFTFGSPIVIYFILLFWLEQKQLLKPRRPTIWDI
ncbi:MAG: hypothetical protein Kow0075_06730 [Salibacteraceae bacterium]